jgi:Fic family protein
MARLIPNQQILINALTIKESKDSSEIENIITSEDELYNTIHAREYKSTAQAKEVFNYSIALNRGTELIKDQGFLRVNDIIELQSLIVGNGRTGRILNVLI